MEAPNIALLCGFPLAIGILLTAMAAPKGIPSGQVIRHVSQSQLEFTAFLPTHQNINPGITKGRVYMVNDHIVAAPPL